ncbi:carbohydrate deacetylase [Callorhinchus milii]|uniref:Carbohydrate deacetylase n=1 Tax=Callorhinchus milii TaxID=7868 RepID=V9L3L1_CALMI|nr:carbohydrate deacetylase [Callorhinchus milii]|eukprot:gi/632987512/ref/XP_007882600.1/ PREDICTED: UPF0249 protein ydjC homolog [Callorhinchus milii]
MPQPRVRLIVTGDDFGYCSRRNRGIVECFKAGAVSNASLLVNGNSAQEAATLASRHGIPLGLHANLSEGLPVAQPLRLGLSLLNKRGVFHGKMGFRDILKSGAIKLPEVDQELRAQVERFRELTGYLPHHMDGHQHVHVLPDIRDVFANVLSDYGIRFTRVPIEPGLRDCHWISHQLMAFYREVEEDAFSSMHVFRRHGIRWPDIYIGLTTMGKHMAVQSIQAAIGNATASQRLKENSLDIAFGGEMGSVPGDGSLTMELMVHPGYPSVPQEGGCGEGPDEFSQSRERLNELKTLKDPRLLKYYEENNILLCAFKHL